MKQLFTIVFTLLALCSQGQDKYSSVHFNKLIEVAGTEFVIALMEPWGKIYSVKKQALLFIDTSTGKKKQVEFPNDGYIQKVEQLKNDSLKINKLVVARTVNLDEKKGFNWEDPLQIFIVSTNGQEKNQLTDNKFFVRSWITNKQTGTIVVTGFSDTNDNNKYDKTEKSEILIYDLKTLKLISKI